jgi:hypothetical protein
MYRAYFLIVTAVCEGVTGLFTLVMPSALLALLIGVEQFSQEVTWVARLAGAALLAIGITCWGARNDHDRPAQFGLLTSLLIYNVAAATLLVYAGLILSMVGLALWPGLVLHAVLAIWCILCLSVMSRGAGGAAGRA